jgi:GNAT superfamily N-acetyltransferase
VTEAPVVALKVPGRVGGMAVTQGSPIGARDLISLDDGTKAVVRPITSADSGALLRFHGNLSARSIRLRYFYPHKDLSPSEVAHFTQVDGEDRVALVVERSRELIAVGRYDRLDDQNAAEVAFVVADAFQHHGLAATLLQRLANMARSVGITRFIAEVLLENRAMLSVFHDAGFPIESKIKWETVELTVTIATGSRGSRQCLDRHTPDEPGPGFVSENLEASTQPFGPTA